MNVKLAAADNQATSIGLYASRVALLVSGSVADAAIALSVAAGELAAATAKEARLGVHVNPAEPFIGGQLPVPPDLKDLEARVDAFRRAAATAVGATRPDQVPVIPGPRMPGG